MRPSTYVGGDAARGAGEEAARVTPLAGVGDADEALVTRAIECYGAAGYDAIEHKNWMDEGDDVDPFAPRK